MTNEYLSVHQEVPPLGTEYIQTNPDILTPKQQGVINYQFQVVPLNVTESFSLQNQQFTLDSTKTLTGEILQKVANDDDLFVQVLRDKANTPEIQLVRSQWIVGDFSQLPLIQVLPSADMNGAFGAYDSINNNIYLSDALFQPNAAPLNSVNGAIGVLVEETFHWLDNRVGTDTPGDEGELARNSVFGVHLSNSELNRINQEDDRGYINVDGQIVSVEMATVSNTASTLQTAQNIGVLGSTSQVFTGFVGDNLVNNYLKFQVTTPGVFSVELNGLTKDANIRLLNDQGGFIQASYNKGTATDAFAYKLNTGTYFTHVYREALGDNTNYTLNLASLPLTDTLSTLQTAKDIGVLDSKTQTFTGSVNDVVVNNYYKIKVANPSLFSVELSGLTKDANIRLLNDQGGFIQASYNKGTATDAFTYQLNSGNYFAHVYREAMGDNTNYTLKLSAPPITVTNPLTVSIPSATTPVVPGTPVSIPPGSSVITPSLPTDGAGNTRETARNIGTLKTTQTFNDFVGDVDKDDFYSFYAAEPGTANISLTNLSQSSRVEFFRGSNTYSDFSASSGYPSFKTNAYISEPGQYYLRVAQDFGAKNTNYTLALSTTSSVLDIGSLNGTRSITGSNNITYYRFKLDQNSVVKVSSNVPNLVSLDVRDSSYKNRIAIWLNDGATLNAGTYYLAVSNNPNSSQPIPSSFTLNLQATPTSRYDNGGLDFVTAFDLGTITSSKSVTDFIDSTDRRDYYSFTVNSKSSSNLNVEAITGKATVDVYLYNDKYNQIGNSSGFYGTPKPLLATLEPGKYYVQIMPGGLDPTDVQYRLNINVQSLTANDAIGDTFAQAKDLGQISPNYPITPIKDAIGGADTADWFRFSTNKLGNLLPVLDGLTTPISLQLMRIESNGSLTSLGTQSSNNQSNWKPVFNNLTVGNYALALTSNSTVSSPYTLNISTVSTNTAPTNLKLNLAETYGSNQDVIVTGSVYDANGAKDIDEVWFNINGQTYFVKNFTTSSTDSNVANFSYNIGKLPIGSYDYSAGAYDKSRDSSGTTITMGQTPVKVIQQITTPSTGSSFQVAPEILPYYSSLSGIQQNKLGSPLSANASNTNGSWRQDFQNGYIIAFATSTPTVYFNDGTRLELSNSLIQPLPVVGTLIATGSVSGNLSSSDAKDQFRSSFYDDYALSGFTSGKQVRLTLTGSGFVPQIYLIDAVTGQTQQQSTVIQNGNQAILDFVVPTTGNYRVRVTSGNANQTGSYTLAADNTPVALTPSGNGSTGSTGTLPNPTYRITESVNEAKEWRANLFQWNRNNGTTPPVNFYEGGDNNPNWIGTLNLGSNSGKSLKFDWGTGTVKGNRNLPADGFAIRAYTWADFDGSQYKFNVRADDGFQILAKRQSDGQWFYITPKDQWKNAGYGQLSTVTAQLPAGRYDLHIHYFEYGGEAKMDLSWDKVTAISNSPTNSTSSTNNTTFPQPDFTLSVYRQNNIFWTSGYAPNSTNPSNPKLGNALGNCTWYVNGRLQQLGYSTSALNKLSGNAYDWDNQALAAGIQLSNTPKVGAIAQWESGHVAVVERVNSDGTIVISESSYSAVSGTAYDYLYHTRTISATNPTRYIIVPLNGETISGSSSSSKGNSSTPSPVIDNGQAGMPYISISGVYNASSGSSNITTGSKILITGKTSLDVKSIGFLWDNTVLTGGVNTVIDNPQQFSISFQLPQNLAPGEYLLKALDWSGNNVSSFIVNVVSPLEQQKPWELELHKTYEHLAKEIAYQDLKTREENMMGNVDNLYYIDQVFGRNSKTGFDAIGLTPMRNDRPPVLVFRGTEPNPATEGNQDMISDISMDGIGSNQFAENQEAIKQWLQTMNSIFGKPDVIGHSLGGALAQLTTAQFYNLVGRTVTFNSPGISKSISDSNVKSDKITHYIVIDDLVSKGGEKFLPGKFVSINYSDYFKDIWKNLPDLPPPSTMVTGLNKLDAFYSVLYTSNNSSKTLSYLWALYHNHIDTGLLSGKATSIELKNSIDMIINPEDRAFYERVRYSVGNLYATNTSAYDRLKLSLHNAKNPVDLLLGGSLPVR